MVQFSSEKIYMVELTFLYIYGLWKGLIYEFEVEQKKRLCKAKYD